jgi:hypothetical protein
VRFRQEKCFGRIVAALIKSDEVIMTFMTDLVVKSTVTECSYGIAFDKPIKPFGQASP